MVTEVLILPVSHVWAAGACVLMFFVGTERVNYSICFVANVFYS